MKHLFLILLLLVIGRSAVSADPPVTTKQYTTPTLVQGYLIKGGAQFYENGVLCFARLAKTDSAFGQWLPENTGIHFTPDGKPNWCFLGQSWNLQGYTFHGGGHEWQTCFYPSGKLLSGGLLNETMIDGIPCAPGTFWNEVFGGGGRTYFYENGRLKYAKVARTVVYRGQTIKSGKHVKLKPDGAIEKVK